MNQKLFVTVAIVLSVSSTTVFSQALTPEQQTKVNAKLQNLVYLGNDATVIKEVNAMTAKPPLPGMTNDKWKALTLISPEVKSLTKNALATYLKGKTDESVAELFVSDTAGNKVAFFSKTTSYSHKGKPKHDVPMTGKTWIGEIEVDESTGIRQVQVSFPIIDNKKNIGTIVVGCSIDKL